MIGMVEVNSLLSFICDFFEKALMIIEIEAFWKSPGNLTVVLTQLQTI